MHIEIREQEIAGAIQRAASAGIEKGVSNWEVQQEISKAAAQAVSTSEIVQIVKSEVERQCRDRTADISGRVAQAVLPAIEMALVGAFRAVAVQMLVSLRRTGYMTTAEEQALRQKIEEELSRGEKNGE